MHEMPEYTVNETKLFGNANAIVVTDDKRISDITRRSYNE
jgi:hypothetical protein